MTSCDYCAKTGKVTAGERYEILVTGPKSPPMRHVLDLCDRHAAEWSKAVAETLEYTDKKK